MKMNFKLIPLSLRGTLLICCLSITSLVSSLSSSFFPYCPNGCCLSTFPLSSSSSLSLFLSPEGKLFGKVDSLPLNGPFPPSPFTVISAEISIGSQCITLSDKPINQIKGFVRTSSDVWVFLSFPLRRSVSQIPLSLSNFNGIFNLRVNQSEISEFFVPFTPSQMNSMGIPGRENVILLVQSEKQIDDPQSHSFVYGIFIDSPSHSIQSVLMISLSSLSSIFWGIPFYPSVVGSSVSFSILSISSNGIAVKMPFTLNLSPMSIFSDSSNGWTFPIFNFVSTVGQVSLSDPSMTSQFSFTFTDDLSLIFTVPNILGGSAVFSISFSDVNLNPSKVSLVNPISVSLISVIPLPSILSIGTLMFHNDGNSLFISSMEISTNQWVIIDIPTRQFTHEDIANNVKFTQFLPFALNDEINSAAETFNAKNSLNSALCVTIEEEIQLQLKALTATHYNYNYKIQNFSSHFPILSVDPFAFQCLSDVPSVKNVSSNPWISLFDYSTDLFPILPWCPIGVPPPSSSSSSSFSSSSSTGGIQSPSSSALSADSSTGAPHINPFGSSSSESSSSTQTFPLGPSMSSVSSGSLGVPIDSSSSHPLSPNADSLSSSSVIQSDSSSSTGIPSLPIPSSDFSFFGLSLSSSSMSLILLMLIIIVGILIICLFILCFVMFKRRRSQKNPPMPSAIPVVIETLPTDTHQKFTPNEIEIPQSASLPSPSAPLISMSGVDIPKEREKYGEHKGEDQVYPNLSVLPIAPSDGAVAAAIAVSIDSSDCSPSPSLSSAPSVFNDFLNGGELYDPIERDFQMH